MEFRRAKMDDLNNIKKLFERIVWDLQRHGLDFWDEVYPLNWFEGDIASGQLYVLLDGEAPVSAFALCSNADSDDTPAWSAPKAPALYLLRLGVDPTRSGTGIGSLALQYACNTAKALGAEYLRLLVVDSNTRAMQFYEKNGWKRIPGVYELSLEDGVLREYGYEIELFQIQSSPTPAYTIIPYDHKYRDDMVYMVLDAKNALGRVPTINPDLLDIHANYLAAGDAFWLAIDDGDRVIGCIGYSSIAGTDEARLHRLYVKADLKRRGIGSALLQAAEQHLKNAGKTAVSVHLGGKEYWESYSFYPKHGYRLCGDRMMKKEL